MISHIFLGTNDIVRAEAFYGPILDLLGWRLRFSEGNAGWIGWEPAAGGRPLFIVGRAHDGHPATASNGGMTALMSPDRQTVDAVHALALGHGGTDEGPPGLRPHYHADFYGAYFRDPDGNKLCVCCHRAPADRDTPPPEPISAGA